MSGKILRLMSLLTSKYSSSNPFTTSLIPFWELFVILTPLAIGTLVETSTSHYLSAGLQVSKNNIRRQME